MNVVELIARHAACQPHAPALVAPDVAIGYAEAHERVRRMAAALRARGIGAGDRVALCLTTSATHLLAMLALARLGAVALPLHPLRPGDELAVQMRRYGAVAAIGRGAVPPDPALRHIAADDALLAPIDATERARPDADGGERDLFIAQSSGTTGEPKAVAWSHRRVISQWERMQSLRPHGPGVRIVAFMGYDASYPLQAALRMLFSGGAVVVVPGVSLRWLAVAVDRLGAQHVLSSPAIVERLLRELPADGPRFPQLQSVHLGGSSVSPRLHAELQRRLATNICVNCGSSEVGGLSYGVPGLLARVPGSSGRVSPWVHAEAVDDDGRPLPPGTSGVLRYRGDDFPTHCVAADGEPPKELLRDGWYYPGDVGRVEADGTLVVEARVDDLVNVGGTKVRPADVEQTLLEDPVIADAAAFGMPGAAGGTVLAAAVVCRAPIDAAATLARCRNRLGARAPQRLFVLRSLPRNAAGKLLRRELAARVARAAKAATT